MKERNIPKDFIERICISVNSICNFRCRYCYFFTPQNRVKHEPALTSSEIHSILTNALQYYQQQGCVKPIKVNFVGSGEPLLNWNEISQALHLFGRENPNQVALRFYVVTNASLLSPRVAREMKYLNVFPSVSLDGPRDVHNFYRVNEKGDGTFEETMKGIESLRKEGFEIAINTTITAELVRELDSFLEFIEENKISKIIFGRLVDAPEKIEPIPNHIYYLFLKNLQKSVKEHKLEDLEIGNLVAYQRNLERSPDQVCTLFGGSCGAGTHFLIFLGREVYPCGRMFGQTKWKLGASDTRFSELQKRMYKRIPHRNDCQSCSFATVCVRDCLLDSGVENYSCDSRKNFLKEFASQEST